MIAGHCDNWQGSRMGSKLTGKHTLNVQKGGWTDRWLGMFRVIKKNEQAVDWAG